MISTSSLPAALYTPESQHMGGGMENGNMAGSMQYGYMANKPPTPTSNFGASSRTNIPQRGQQMLPSHHHHQQQLAYSNNYNVGSANNNFHGYAGEQQRAAALHAMNGSNHPQPHPNLYVQPSRHKAVDFHGQQLHSATNNNPYTAAMNNSSFNGGYRGNNPPFPGVDSRALGGGIHQELGINDQGRSAAGVNHFESHYNSGTSAAPGLSRRKSPLDALDFSSSDAFSGSVPINPYANNAQTQLNVFSSLRSVGGSSSGNHEFADFNMNTADYLLDSQSSSNQLVGDNSSRYGGSMKGSNPFSIHDGLSQSSMSTMDDMNLGTIRNDSQQTRSTAEFDELSTNTPDSGNNMQSFSSYQYHRF